ncbi:MAG: NHL repeat-containing protein [Candidatus Hydrogenedentota bacterium]
MKNYFSSILLLIVLVTNTRAKEPGYYELLQSGKRLYEGIISFYLGDYNSAKNYFNESLNFYPDNIETLYYFGKLNLLMGDPKKANECWQKIQDKGYGDTYPVGWKIKRSKNWENIKIGTTDDIFSTDKYTLIKEIYGKDIGTGFFSLPVALYYNPSDNYLYLSSYATDEIVILNQNGERIKEFKFKRGSKPKGFFFEKDKITVGLFNINKVRIINYNGKTIKEIGGLGKLKGELSGPSFITKDVFENIYITESGNHRISIFDKSYNCISMIGGYGIEPGLFINPCDLLFDRDGFLYVIDKNNNRIEKFDINGLILQEFKNPQFFEPQGFSSIKDDLFFIVTKNGNVFKMKNGNLLNETLILDNINSDTIVSISDIEIDNKDYLYLSDLEKSRIRIYRPSLIKDERIFLDIKKIDVSHYEKEHLLGIYFTVTDDRGFHYPNLNKNNFAVYENNNRVYPIDVSKIRSDKTSSVHIVISKLKENEKKLVEVLEKELDFIGIKNKYYFIIDSKKNKTITDMGSIYYKNLESALDKALWNAYLDKNLRNVILITAEDLKEDSCRKIIYLAKGLHLPISIVSDKILSNARYISQWTGGNFFDINSPYFKNEFRRLKDYNFQEEYLVVYRTPYRKVPYKTMFEVKVILNLFRNEPPDPKAQLIQDRAVYFVP